MVRIMYPLRCVQVKPVDVCKLVCVLFSVALACFLVEEYVVMDMWNARRYRKLTACSEQYYNFPAGAIPGLLLADVSLMRECGAFNSSTTETDHVTCSRPTGAAPVVRTKCGHVTASLISRRRHIRPRCEDKVVPNVVHYVSLGSWKFSFLNYLSFRSVDLIQKPDYILVHGDGLPHGPWWQRTLVEIRNVYHVMRKRPERIQGRKVRWLEHSSDIIRLQTIWDNGGIYLDTDILVLKSLDPLRYYEMTLGRETTYGLGSGVILAKPRAPFVCVWFNVFRDYNPFPWNWAYYAVMTPNRLASVLPARLHVENDTLHKPSWQQASLLFEKRVDWSKSYTIHVWKRYGHVPESPDQIVHLNTTLGEIMRYIYYNMTPTA